MKQALDTAYTDSSFIHVQSGATQREPLKRRGGGGGSGAMLILEEAASPPIAFSAGLPGGIQFSDPVA